MARQPRQNTYNLILETALELFNQAGERTVTTNHIAKKLKISPGNLYYHFSNKDAIILQLHHRYSSEMMAWIREADAPGSLADVTAHLGGVFDIMWNYRFLFNDTNFLLERNTKLLGSHNEFTRAKASPMVMRYLKHLSDIGLLAISEADCQDLALNMWIITKYWFDFHGTVSGRTRQNKLPEDTKRLGVLRNLSLLKPYLNPRHTADFEAEAAKFARRDGQP
ncbi:MAG: TetR/AcrR family transcriptional regulator [Neisseria sp.]|nr:TetR/AcrR family transcriptional regulator [Neisseria sp.]